MSGSAIADVRVLGAVRFVDAVSGADLDDALVVHANEGVLVRRNRRGVHVLVAGRASTPPLQRESEWFDEPPTPPPARPAVASVAVRLTVHDPLGRYLDRAVTLQLPRDADPARAADAASLFQAVAVQLYSAPARAAALRWPAVRVSAPGSPNALVRVVAASLPAGGARLGAGMTDVRGEALVAMAGLATSGVNGEPGGGAVLSRGLAARVELVADATDATGPPDPDDLEARRATLTVRTATVTLAAGRTASLTL